MSVDMFPTTGVLVEMFPHTDDIHSGVSGHVECVCLLSNRKPDTRVKIGVDLEDYYRIKDEQKKPQKKIEHRT